ncbi:MAG TPA: ABC transporter substrate-binding protein [Thermotogota bacterium]|nr:ABC transporter substrate-binding protein [Thermotogota bacterium]HRW91876.1 ABC transporter substrate-binding protein [Thermotogota bacterium]
MKKILFFLVLGLLVAFLGMAEKVQVEFWHAMGGGHGEAVTQIVEMFNQQHDDIEIVPVYIGNYGALNQKLLASVQSDTLPVLSQAYGNWTSKLLQSDIVQPLNEFIDNPTTGFTQAEWEDIYRPFREMCTWGETVYGVPFNKSVYVMYYNTDVFEFEGLEPPETLDEFYEYAKMLTVDEDGDGVVDQYGFGFRSTVDHFTVLLLNMGGTIAQENPDGSYTVTLNSQEARDTLAFMKKMKDEGIAFVQGGYLDGPFGEGKIAGFIETIASKPYVESASKGKHGWNWTKVPTGVDFRPPFAGTDVIMFSSASDAEKAAGWEFLKFITSAKVTTFWALKTGYLPVRKSALETAEWKAYTKLEPMAAFPSTIVDSGYVDPKPATWNEIRGAVGDMVNNVLFDKWTIEEGLAWAETEINNYLATE